MQWMIAKWKRRRKKNIKVGHNSVFTYIEKTEEEYEESKKKIK